MLTTYMQMVYKFTFQKSKLEKDKMSGHKIKVLHKFVIQFQGEVWI